MIFIEFTQTAGQHYLDKSCLLRPGEHTKPDILTRLIPLIAILLSFWSACHATDTRAGHTYYVSITGSDKNDGASWRNAWKTLKHAGATAVRGDIVIVRKGNVPYRYLGVRHSGTENLPITFRGEDPQNPPVISGAHSPRNWYKSTYEGVWRTTVHKPILVIEDEHPLPPASSPQCLDGYWYWENKYLYYKPKTGTLDKNSIRISSPVGIVIGNNSWIVIENFTCVLSNGACVAIKGGHHNSIKDIHSKWSWRGINIENGAHHNLVENCLVDENREGIYILRGSSWNTVKNCKALRNGNYPVWSRGDRAGIAIGEHGPNIGNTIEFSEIAYNGGPESDPGLIAYDAPQTTLRGNHVHDNYGSGVFVTINSHESLVIDNHVEHNGWDAAKDKQKGIAALSVRWGSHKTRVLDNRVIDNHVSRDSRWPGKGIGPKGGLDVQGAPRYNMSDMVIKNNQASGTVGGPDIFISPDAPLSGLIMEPKP